MSQYPFTLEKYKGKPSRYRCPQCHEKYEFSRYINTKTNAYVHDDVGICNNKNKCNYHYPPREYFKDLKRGSIKPKLTAKPKSIQKDNIKNSMTSYHPQSVINKYQKNESYNTFYISFQDLFGEELINALKIYRVGTYNSSYLKGAIIYWQIDLNNKVRAGKIMKYNTTTGKRKYQNWYHSIKNIKDFNIRQVPFGLHLINKYPQRKIAIVEGEKTAILMSIASPNFNWISVGSCQNLTEKMLSSIQNKIIVLYPDAGKYEFWKEKISNLPKSNIYYISDLLQNKASEQEKEEDYDIADYYIDIVNEYKHRLTI